MDILEEVIFLKTGQSVLVNSRYVCVLKSEFSRWKDPNSNSVLKTADVEIFDKTNDVVSGGKLQIQVSPDLMDGTPYGALVFIDVADKSKWHMYTIVNAKILELKPKSFKHANPMKQDQN